MFSKFVTHNFTSSGTSNSTSTLSIAARLTLWQAMCGMVVLVAVTSLLYWTLVKSLDSDDDQFLSERMAVLLPLLAARADSPAELAAEITRESGGHNRARLYIRLLAGDGTILGETAGMAHALPSELFPKLLDRGSAGIKHFDLDTTAGRPFRAATAVVSAVGATNTTIVHMALDRTREELLLRTYRTYMGIMLVIGLLLFAVTTWLISGRAMRPVASFTRIVQEIQANRMHPRVGAGHWPGELTELARSFDAMLERLERAFQALERFSADIAHELRSPLNILRGEAEVALQHAVSSDEYRAVLESSLEEYDRLSRLVDALLFLARAEHGSDEIQKKTLDARAEALAVCDFYETVAAEHRVTMNVTGNAALLADPMLVRRSLSNLLSNALRHTPMGGTVQISIAQSINRGVTIEVADTGCGIAAEHLPRVFDRFYRADEARARDAEGAGLGLAIVKAIMALHGGSVAIDNNPARGATVTLCFP